MWRCTTAGQIFNPDWLAVVQDARELRFMDWMAVNGVTPANWDDRPQVGDVTWSGGVPVEVMVDLANQTGTEPWFTMPAGADEAYIRNFATYVRDHLEPGLQVHVEYSNEMWNWAFGQTKWLGAQAKADWGSSDGAAWLDYAAMLATKSALIWDDVFGADADARLDHVLGTQTANAWIADRLLTAPLWQTTDPEGYVAPASVFDSLAVTTYFGGSTMGRADRGPSLLAVLKTPGVDATAWLAARLMDPVMSVHPADCGAGGRPTRRWLISMAWTWWPMRVASMCCTALPWRAEPERSGDTDHLSDGLCALSGHGGAVSRALDGLGRGQRRALHAVR